MVCTHGFWAQQLCELNIRRLIEFDKIWFGLGRIWVALGGNGLGTNGLGTNGLGWVGGNRRIWDSKIAQVPKVVLH